MSDLDKVLVTGASGFLGYSICNDPKSIYGSTIGVSKSTRVPVGTKSYVADITDARSMHEIIAENSPTAIIHTAARSIVRDCEINPGPAFQVNVLGTINILEAARQLQLDIPIVVLETDKVYGQQPKDCIPTHERHELLGNSPYEYSKVMTAQVCEFYRNYYGMRIYSLRPANLYGLHDMNLSRIVPGTFSKIKNGETPIVFTDSRTQLREYVYVNDVVEIIGEMITSRPPVGAYNISSGEVMSPEQVIREILDATRSPLGINVVEKPFEFKEIHTQRLSGDKLDRNLGYQFTPFKTAIAEIWSQMQKTA
jgi:nucleoside-diphosphate-sugar epimerase